MESLPCKCFAHRGLRLPASQEESQPGARPNGVGIWLRNVHQLQDLVGFVEEHRSCGQKRGEPVRSAPSVTTDEPGLEVSRQYALAHLMGWHVRLKQFEVALDRVQDDRLQNLRLAHSRSLRFVVSAKATLMHAWQTRKAWADLSQSRRVGPRRRFVVQRSVCEPCQTGRDAGAFRKLECRPSRRKRRPAPRSICDFTSLEGRATRRNGVEVPFLIWLSVAVGLGGWGIEQGQSDGPR